MWHDKLSSVFNRYVGGGGSTPKTTTPITPPTAVSPGVEKAKDDIRKRMMRAKGRAATEVSIPSLVEMKAPTARPGLKEVLG